MFDKLKEIVRADLVIAKINNPNPGDDDLNFFEACHLSLEKDSIHPDQVRKVLRQYEEGACPKTCLWVLTKRLAKA